MLTKICNEDHATRSVGHGFKHRIWQSIINATVVLETLVLKWQWNIVWEYTWIYFRHRMAIHT